MDIPELLKIFNSFKASQFADDFWLKNIRYQHLYNKLEDMAGQEKFAPMIGTIKRAHDAARDLIVNVENPKAPSKDALDMKAWLSSLYKDTLPVVEREAGWDREKAKPLTAEFLVNLLESA